MYTKQKETRTYADRREYLIKYVTKRRRLLKAKAIKHKGGKCQICGYCRYQGALDLHHIDPANKEFGLGYKGYSRSWDRIEVELEKCILICSNCHRELEAGVISL